MAVSEQVVFKIDEFGGIDNSTDDALLPLGSAGSAANFDITKGTLNVVKGTSLAYENGIDGMEIRRIMPLYIKDGPSMLVALAWNPLLKESDVYYTTNNVTANWTKLIGPSVTIGDNIFSHVNYQRDSDDIILFADGGWLKYWNGVDEYITRIQAQYAPLGMKYITLGNERVWGTGIGHEPDRVYYSKAFNPTDWSSNETDPDKNGGFIDLPTWERGGRIIGICEAFGDIIVFKSQDIFRIYGDHPSQFSIDRLSGINGPVSNDAIVKHNNVVYYLSLSGLHYYDGVKSIRLSASDKVRDAWEWLSYENEPSAHMTIYDNKLYISLPMQVVSNDEGVMTSAIQPNRRLLIYDLNSGSFMDLQGMHTRFCTSFALQNGKDIKEYLLFSQNDANLFKFDNRANTYNGAPIKAYWETPWIDFKRKDVTKYVTAVYAFAAGEDGAKLVVEAVSESRRKIRVIPAEQQNKTMRCKIRLKGKRFRLRFANFSDDPANFVEAKPIELKGGIHFIVELDED